MVALGITFFAFKKQNFGDFLDLFVKFFASSSKTQTVGTSNLIFPSIKFIKEQIIDCRR